MEKQINIIGISGKILSGKDTVAGMIQELTAEYKPSPFEGGTNSHPTYKTNVWEIKKFSKKLKTIASILTGIPEEKFEDQEFKNTNLGSEWNIRVVVDGMAMGENLININEWPNTIEKPYLIREFLQRLGTDAIRNNLHSDAWINAFWIDYIPIEIYEYNVDLNWKERQVYIKKHQYPPPIKKVKFLKEKRMPKWLITDCRFLNEVKSIKEHGGIVIRLTRNQDKQSTHQSETELDNYDFDYTIDNQHLSLEETYKEVEKMLNYFNIL